MLRRLVAIELTGSATLAPGVAGPLGDNVAQAWLDLPTPITTLLEVRVPDRPVARRLFSIAGLTPEVAARVVAIAVAETVREQTRPARPPKKAPPPKPPSPEEVEQRERGLRAVTFSAAASAALLPNAHGALAGPGLSLAFRDHGASGRMFARYLGGSGVAGPMRWIEVGLGADYRIPLASRVRLGAGLAASGAALHLGDATVIGDGRDAWSARAGGVLSLEGRVAGPAWLGIAVEPGAMLRPVSFVDASGAAGVIQGAWIGLDLTLALETREALAK